LNGHLEQQQNIEFFIDQIELFSFHFFLCKFWDIA